MQSLTLINKFLGTEADTSITYFNGKTYKERKKQAEFYVYTSLGLSRKKYKISLKNIK